MIERYSNAWLNRMPIFTEQLPLSLYIHIPWCVQKCPYCDFNSHTLKDKLPEELYVDALIEDMQQHTDKLGQRPIQTIFIGGGTPSLFSGQAMGSILNAVAKHLSLSANAEITLEANPGTVDQKHFADYRAAGINRLSLGVQSLQDQKLKLLGRIHDRNQAGRAVKIAKDAGFDNFNVDIMFGLPQQSHKEALQDLRDALNFESTHLSWYQLTIEPNTVFYSKPPTLPPDDDIWEMQLAGQELLAQHGLKQYEVSAYAQRSRQCLHNLNYWQFGDYLGIGAGAHSKITYNNQVIRFAQVRQPASYLDASKRQNMKINVITEKDLAFEFMLNALRLTDGVPRELFTAHTGIPVDSIQPQLDQACEKGLLENNQTHIKPTELGRKFLNDLVGMFLE